MNPQRKRAKKNDLQQNAVAKLYTVFTEKQSLAICWLLYVEF